MRSLPDPHVLKDATTIDRAVLESVSEWNNRDNRQVASDGVRPFRPNAKNIRSSELQ